MSTPDDPSRRIMHPLALNSFRLWAKLALDGGPIDSPRGMLRAACITTLSPLTIPFRLWETWRYSKIVSRSPLQQPPIFIVGHWRTGTTYLHNLLSLDPALAYVPTFQTLAPAACLVGQHTLRPLLAPMVPKKRHMDNMDLSLDLPQEEEVAISHLCPHSFYIGWYFPRRLKELFRRCVLLEGMTDQQLVEWRDAYQQILRKASYMNQGRRLVLKNPANTGRIPALLECFPGAKFIHIHRNPYHVYPSTLRFHRTTLDLVSLQRIAESEINENVLLFYCEMMTRFIQDRHLIPTHDFAEVSYDELISRPIDTLARLYRELDLSGWDTAYPHIADYLTRKNGYEPNVFTMNDADATLIEKHWKFAIDEWGYSRPGQASKDIAAGIKQIAKAAL